MLRALSVELLKSSGTVRYQGEVLRQGDDHILIHARWTRERLELPFVTFETGDHLLEHFYQDRHYNVFELRSIQGVLKGWYCNFCRPAELAGDILRSEDLDLDLFVTPERGTLLLDEAEFEARSLDDATRQAVLAALAELRGRVRSAFPPFDSSAGLVSLGIGNQESGDKD